MRYSVVSKELTLSQVEAECRRYGSNVRSAKWSEVVFCELDKEGRSKLESIPGLKVKPVEKTTGHVMPPPTPVPEAGAMVYGSFQANYASLFYEFRESFTPPLTGRKLVVAVIGSGIHKDHIALKDKVTYEKNFSDSPTLDDVFDHDTGVAYLIAGGSHAAGVESGLAPGAKLMNIKVLNDDGNGSTEALIMGMNEVHDLFAHAAYNDLPYGHPMYPNAVNISIGAEDDGDPDNPIRLAVEKLYQASPGKFPIFCSASNSGPTPQTITLPAAAKHAWAVGAVCFSPFEVCEYSGRGPVILTTGEELVKPEMVFYGHNILVASSKSNDAYVRKAGTSFASPMAAGQLCLMREAAEAYGVFEKLLVMEYEELEYLVNAMSWKPREPVMTKENDWGYGMPIGTLMGEQFRPAAGVGISAMVEQMTPILALGMMGAMIVPITKGFA